VEHVLLIVHLLWATWMVAGVIWSAAGFIRHRLWAYATLRTAHLIGFLLTATVPIWNRGICPITEWEFAAADRGGSPEPLLIRLARDILYWDVSPTVLSIVSGSAALFTLGVYILRPPWRYTRASHDRRSTSVTV